MPPSSVTQFRGKYRGHRAFLIGNGPSLRRTSLDSLAGEYTFAMNRIALIYPETIWRPSFFVCSTTNVQRDAWRKDIHATTGLGMPTFIWDKLAEHFTGFQNIHPLNCTDGQHIVAEAEDAWWSYDAAERVSKFGTSMLVAMQLAVYMEFNPIYLVGCDLGFAPDPTQKKQAADGATDPNHFHPDYGTPGCTAEQLNMNMRAAHHLAKRMTDRIGVTIYNATVGGELDIYPRADLHQLTRIAA